MRSNADLHLRKGAYYGNIWCFNEIGKHYQDAGDEKNAERWYRVPLKLEYPPTMWNMALIYKDRKQYSEAIKLFEKVNDSNSHKMIKSLNKLIVRNIRRV